MKVFLPIIHGDHDHFMIDTLSHLGFEVHIPDMSFVETGIQSVKTGINDPFDKYLKCRRISIAEFMDTQYDILFIQTIQHTRDLLALYHKKSSPIVYVSGNNMDMWTYPQQMEHQLCFDIQNFKYGNSKHKTFVLPYLDMGDKYKERVLTPEVFDKKKVSSYVYYYQNEQWVTSYRQMLNLRNHLKEAGFQFDIYGTDFPVKRDRIPDASYMSDSQMRETHPYYFVDDLADSLAVAHIKPLEGYGFNVWKAMMIGRPVIAYVDDVKGKTYNSFLLDGITAFLCDRGKEPQFYKYLVDKLNDYQFMQEMSDNCAKHIRNVVEPDLQYSKMQLFISEVLNAPVHCYSC